MALELNGTTGVSLVQDGVVTAADLNFSTGKVLQVVAANGRVADFRTASTTLVLVSDSSITITPTSASSRIFVTWQITTHQNSNSTGQLNAYRGTTDLGVVFGTRNTSADAGSDYFDKTTQVSIIDHPNTTAATTYSLYAKKVSGTYDMFAHRSFVDDQTTPIMRMVAMEIDMSTEWSS